MNIRCWLSATCLALTQLSCASPSTPQSPPAQPWLGEAIRNAGLDRAVIVQRALFPYHFVDGSAELNDIGSRDLSVLADHFRAHPPGSINVRRGDAPQALYQARVASVLDTLAAAGLDRNQIHIGDGFAGGDGMTSERATKILAQPATPLTGGERKISTGTSAPTTPQTSGGLQ